MLKDFGQTKIPETADRVLYASLPSPDSGLEPGDLVRLAPVSFSVRPGNERVLGAALYRAGDYAGAIEQFDESAAEFNPRPWDWFFVGMCHQHLGHPDKAREYLQKANQGMSTLTCPWTERVEMQQLRKEAERLIKN
jgi:tetratricopeptide (TPR) repeat protein